MQAFRGQQRSLWVVVATDRHPLISAKDGVYGDKYQRYFQDFMAAETMSFAIATSESDSMSVW